MGIGNLWLEYCAMRLGGPPDRNHVEHLGPDPVLDLLWTWTPLFTARMDGFVNVAYDTAFDNEADNGLMLIAYDNGFDRVDAVVKAGGWRVLFERLAYSATAVALSLAAGEDDISILPLGLNNHERAIALGLAYLGGEGRTIDRRVLPLSPRGTLPGFASLSLRKQ